MQYPVSARRSGFTLVELLIVIGVIVVLIALLLPSVASVRARARTAECQSNLTQLGLALNAANRNRSTPVRSSSWAADIAPFLEGENEELFVCPADFQAENRNAEEQDPTNPQFKGSFGANNQMHRMQGSDANKFTLVDLGDGDADGTNESQFFVSPEQDGDNQWSTNPNGQAAWDAGINDASDRHAGNINVLHSDGSVSAESSDDLLENHPGSGSGDWVPWRFGDERWEGSNTEVNPDRDGDGILNSDDNCPDTFNPDQADADGNDQGDACEPAEEEEEETGGEDTGGEDTGGEEPYESGPPPDPYEPCEDEPVDPTGASEKALEWLVAQQQSDGSWQFTSGYPGGATGAALLALLGSGHTPFSGTYKQEVCDGLKFLLSYQGPNGSLEPAEGGSAPNGSNYAHLFAYLALAEAVILSEEAQSNGCDEGCDLTIAQLTQAGTQAQNFTVFVNQMSIVGWGDATPNGPGNGGTGDVTQTSFALLCLLASQKAGFTENYNNFTDLRLMKVDEYLKSTGHNLVEDPNEGTSIHANYYYGDERFIPGQPQASNSALGLLARVVISKMNGANHSAYGAMPVEHKAVEVFFENASDASASCEIYYLKPATFLAYLRGGDIWTKWNTALVSMLTETQNPDGSWDFTGCMNTDGGQHHDCNAGGPVFYTSWAILSLGAGYAGLQIFD